MNGVSPPPGCSMSIRLTPEQAGALAAETDLPVAVIDPRTRRTYRLVPEDEYASLTGQPYDDSPWTPAETAALAAELFGKLDDTDYCCK
jgi:hypothetical protein